MKKLLIALLALAALSLHGASPAYENFDPNIFVRIGNNIFLRTNNVLGVVAGGGGGVVSNAYSINLVVGTTYTNATPYYALVHFNAYALVTSNEISTAVFGSVDNDGNGSPETTASYAESTMVKLASASNRMTINLTVPVRPNTAFKINAGVGTPLVLSGYGWIQYSATNSPGSFNGNITGNAATATTAATATRLSAPLPLGLDNSISVQFVYATGVTELATFYNVTNGTWNWVNGILTNAALGGLVFALDSTVDPSIAGYFTNATHHTPGSDVVAYAVGGSFTNNSDFSTINWYDNAFTVISPDGGTHAMQSYTIFSGIHAGDGSALTGINLSAASNYTRSYIETVNGLSQPQHVNLGGGLKRINYKLYNKLPFKILDIGDGQVTYGTYLDSILPKFLSRNGSATTHGAYKYYDLEGGAVGTVLYGQASPIHPVQLVSMPNGSSMTNFSTSVQGFPTDLITLNYIKFNNTAGTLTVQTQAFNGTKATCFVVDTDSGGALSLQVSNRWVPFLTNMVVSVYSTDTNLCWPVGQFTTNLYNGYSIADWTVGSCELSNYFANATLGDTTISNTTRAFLIGNDFDLILIHEIDGGVANTASNEVYKTCSWLNNTLTNSGLYPDVVLITPLINNVSDIVQHERPGWLQAARDFNWIGIDNSPLTFPATLAEANKLLDTNDVHATVSGNFYATRELANALGLTPDKCLIYGLTNRP